MFKISTESGYPMALNDPNVIIIKYLASNGVFAESYVLTTDTNDSPYYVLKHEAESVCNQIINNGYFVARYTESPFALVLVRNSDI